MSDRLLLIGAEESPYSVKVRAYLRYKGLPFDWQTRWQAAELFQRHARLPLIPLLVTPDDRGLQDSTPIIETLESEYPEPTITPPDPLCAFVSALLEEFADEWGNKWMFHYRWAREADQIACSERLAALQAPDADPATLAATAHGIRERMVDRVWFVGSSPATAPVIEASFKDSLALLDAHLTQRPYLFGGRPALADFGLWGQLYNAHRDPTPRSIIDVQAPAVRTWIDRMATPEASGDFEDWPALARTLRPLLADQVAGLFLPWSAANARAIAAGEEHFRVQLRGGSWEQRPQKYHARSLAALRARYAAAAGVPGLAAVMAECDCAPWLDG